MSNTLSRDVGEKGTKRTGDNVRDSIVRAVDVVLEESESGGSAESGGRSMVRPFLVVDLGVVLDSLRGNRGGATEAIEHTVEETAQTRASEGQRGSGRGMLSKLFLVGAIVGLGYMMRKRSGSVGQTVTKATDRAREIADQTEIRSGEVAQRTEAVTGQAADKIEQQGETVADEAADRVRESGEMAADRVQEGGEMASDEIEGAAETAESAEKKAEETAGGDSNEGGGSQSDESSGGQSGGSSGGQNNGNQRGDEESGQ